MIKPGMIVGICDRYPPKTQVLNHELSVARDDMLARMLPDPNEELLELQKASIAEMYTRLSNKENYILADGMGMGKTEQALTTVKLLLNSNAFERVVVVPPPGGAHGWNATIKRAGFDEHEMKRLQVLPSLNPATLKGAFASPNTLVIVDEGHRLKNTNSQRGKVMQAESQATVMLLSGSLVDSPEQITAYNALIKAENLPKAADKAIKHFAAKESLCMRSLEYPDFDVTLQKVNISVNDIEAHLPPTPVDMDKKHDILNYPRALEKYYLEYHAAQTIIDSIDKGRTPILLTDQIDTKIQGDTISMFMAKMMENLGINFVHLKSHPVPGFMDRCAESGPTLFYGTMHSLGTGSNLQDTSGKFPRDLIISGLTFDSIKLLQTFYRVLRPNSMTKPSISLPVSDHPIHQFVLGNLAVKFKESLHRDATITRISKALASVAPLAKDLETSARMYLLTYDLASMPDNLMNEFLRFGHLLPKRQHNSRYYTLDLHGVPDYPSRLRALQPKFETSFLISRENGDKISVTSIPNRGRTFNVNWTQFMREFLQPQVSC